LDIDKYETFFFDFDGVIVDSVNIKTEAFAQLYSSFGKEIVSKVIAYHLSHGGVSRFDKIVYWHKHYLGKEISEQELAALTKIFSDIVFSKVVNASFINGAIEFLNLVKEKNKNIFLVSATPQEEIRRIIKARQLNEYFQGVKGSPTSKKDNMKCFIEEHKLDILNCIYFGDAKEDFDAAASLQIDFIAINYFNKTMGYKNFTDLMCQTEEERRKNV
ncbi:MAG: HAD family hydrolase, partial [Parcubacteria group bacterium]|nr:HAD family hydrolase [Parcubacteria group bacterium]